MDIINQFTSNENDIREAIRGAWGTEIFTDCKITYLAGIVIAQGNLEIIKQKCSVPTYGFNSIGTNIYLAWIKS